LSGHFLEKRVRSFSSQKINKEVTTMREKIKSTSVIIVLFGLILVTFVRVPAWSRGIAPPNVRFTGTFYPPDTKDVKGGIETLKVLIGKRDEKKEWVFNIYKAENLSNASQTGLSILKNIFPRILTLRGPEEVLAKLEKPEIAGKTIKISGLLYRKERFMMVDTVEVSNEETK
jgi:hypothetical protein